MASAFDPERVNLTAILGSGASQAPITCYLSAAGNQYGGSIGIRIGSVFVIGAVSTAVTFFPVAAARVPRLRIPLYAYLFARYFGAGVILATAFVTHQQLHSGDMNGVAEHGRDAAKDRKDYSDLAELKNLAGDSPETEVLFQAQIAAFLILEFGVLFHSVFIGLNLGVAGADDFKTLFPVLVFHQSFEGLGIGARLSAIPFPSRLSWGPWVLCAAYGLTTPIAIAIGLGLRTTYDNSSFTANVVNGLFDSISAGILMYTGFVEMIARDFLFNPERTNKKSRLSFMVICLFLGAGIMALLGKWA
ncbi:hypothetical protein LLEC1_02614 [Akanthomyces lecanii]|uniref:ZIP zinc/iron transport family n=1 Tax=Cordyceps confragosa TaxID=2714763 RepID=A0A179IA78_CORDF|nr:hypothetical protein LLEC1_02614 [Akanthomyces lecanii]